MIKINLIFLWGSFTIYKDKWAANRFYGRFWKWLLELMPGWTFKTPSYWYQARLAEIGILVDLILRNSQAYITMFYPVQVTSNSSCILNRRVSLLESHYCLWFLPSIYDASNLNYVNLWQNAHHWLFLREFKMCSLLELQQITLDRG